MPQVFLPQSLIPARFAARVGQQSQEKRASFTNGKHTRRGRCEAPLSCNYLALVPSFRREKNSARLTPTGFRLEENVVRPRRMAGGPSATRRGQRHRMACPNGMRPEGGAGRTQLPVPRPTLPVDVDSDVVHDVVWLLSFPNPPTPSTPRKYPMLAGFNRLSFHLSVVLFSPSACGARRSTPRAVRFRTN